jgi:extradiol dioxygenase family protein
MAVELNHTIMHSRDKQAAATFFTEILGLGDLHPYGPFLGVQVGGVTFDFMDVDHEIVPQHYAFLVSEDDFDAIFGRISERGLTYWADPFQMQPGEINTNDGGRGVYWSDPNGHFLEIITRPYGSGG